MSIEVPICLTSGCGLVAIRARDGSSVACHEHLAPEYRMTQSEMLESLHLHNAAYTLDRDKELAAVWFQLGRTNPNTFETLWADVQKIREDL